MRRCHLRSHWFCGWGFSSPSLQWVCRKSGTSNVMPQKSSVHKSRERLLPLQPGKATRQQDRIISPMASDDLPHGSLGPHLAISTITLSALAVIIVAGRMYGRIYLLKNAGWDDYCIVIAVLTSLWYTISVCVGVRAGVGRHGWDIPPANLPLISKAPLPIPAPFNPSPPPSTTSP